MDFVHLHLHSEYSLLDGACRIKDIPRRAKELGQSAVAITDHGVMYGAVEFFRACKKYDIKPIIGCEIYLAPDSRFGREKKDLDYSHLVLLCKNERGYRNLTAIVSAAYTEGFYAKPRADMELLREHSDGLVCLSGCLSGRIPKYILEGKNAEAMSFAMQMKEIFGDDFYLEIQNHSIPEQKTVKAGLIMLSDRTGIPLVATNDVHYVMRDDHEAQKVLMCIQTATAIDGTEQMGMPTEEFYMKGTGQMFELFSDTPGAITNTVEIAEKCNFEFDFSKTFLPAFKAPDGLSSKEYLYKLTYEGLDARILAESKKGCDIDREKYIKRIEYELETVCKMGYAEYYLIVRDFIHYAKSKGIPVGPGRGSGAGSLAAWCLGITDVDSIKYNLLFERFLNPERVSMPDFDIDFSDERRGEVIDYVTGKYGADHVSQIVTFGTLKARAVIRDVGRVMGFSYAEVDAVAKLIPQFLDMTIDSALEHVPELKAIYDDDYRMKKLINLSRSLEGMPRHASMHAAGVVITDKPVWHYVPLAANREAHVTQYTMNDIADLGLLKIDFLGLKYLSIIDRAEKEVRKKYPDFDITAVALDDRKTYELLSDGATEGVFQLESAGMRSLLRRMRPASIEDITAAISLYRPGPMDSIPKYLENRRNPVGIRYSDERLRPILEVSNGCIVYQEQVMQICRELGGYSYGAADIVRRAMSKKKLDVMEKEREKFIDGAVSRGVVRKNAEEIFDDMADFAKYAFNKSHAASYAFLAFRTAYLKAHFPREYLASILSVYLESEQKLNLYMSECKKLGIGVLPPDVNCSEADFTVENENIRFGFLAIKGVGLSMVRELIAERTKNGPFRSFESFLLRMPDINRRMLESFIKCGVLDCFGIPRAQLLMVYGQALDTVSRRNRAQIAGQQDLFSNGNDNGNEIALVIDYPDMEEFPRAGLLLMEKETAGIYLSGHPMLDYSEAKEHIGAVDIAEIFASFGDDGTGRFSEHDRVNIMGMISSKKLKVTKNEQQMAFVELEDMTGSIELIVFPNVYEQMASRLREDAVIAVSGEISVKEVASGEEMKIEPKLILRTVLPIEPNGENQPTAKTVPQPQRPVLQRPQNTAAQSGMTDCLYLKVPSEQSYEFERVKSLLDIFSGGNMPVFVYFDDTKTLVRSKTPVMLNDTAYDLAGSILGRENVVIKAKKL